MGGQGYLGGQGDLWGGAGLPVGRESPAEEPIEETCRL